MYKRQEEKTIISSSITFKRNYTHSIALTNIEHIGTPSDLSLIHISKEKEAAELKRNYFGPEGELAKMRDKLITPIPVSYTHLDVYKRQESTY